MVVCYFTGHNYSTAKMPIAHQFSRLSQAKATEVATLLSHLSESEKTPCIVSKLRLQECERVVRGQIVEDTSEGAWDGLLALLKGLTKGKAIFISRSDCQANTSPDTIDWLEEPLPLPTNMNPTQLCTILEECTPNCGGCRSPVWRSSTMEEIEEELELALQTIENRTPYQSLLPLAY